ncbi:MAG: hypothetical protein DLM62_19175 [Pseudonocardiales bacterium]|nr:MAG: hypothetical protein DLM62_19175 [Pseudonocardiales bacterium]
MSADADADADGSGRAAGVPGALRPDAYSTLGDADQIDENAQATLGADLVRLTRAQLWRHTQTAPLPVPMQNPTLLPLSKLEPGVFECLAAEIVSRQDNRGVQFYGRQGQKQHGLDIVERDRTGSRSLYQVKRYEELTGEKIRNGVEEYAGPPRPVGYHGDRRKFDPRRFVLVTSAELDRDTGNVDTLVELQDEYDGDLEIEVWGAEALSRKLRDAPNVVFAVFGPQWAEAYCGFRPAPPDPAAPKSLGLVEGPVAVLHLDSTEADAMTREATDPLAAAQLYGVVARGLRDGNFPGHAAEMRRRQAKAAQAGGDQDTAFSILVDLALDRVLAGEDFVPGSLRNELRRMKPALRPVQQAKLLVLTALVGWYEQGSDLKTTVPALRTLATAGDQHAALLCCLTIEQALVDGLYDFIPARSTVVGTDADTAALLEELRDMASASDSPDVVIRARLRCAVADAALIADANPCGVDIAYGKILGDALAGRLLHARGLVTSRAAYAFAIRGDVDRADTLWRQSILASSEDSFYGDARAAMRASRLLTADSGRLDMTGLEVATSAMPNRRRLLAGAHDPALAALEAAHNDKLPDAFGDTRRYLWEGRLGGHLQEELLAVSLFGDVLAAGGHPAVAVESYVAAGEAEKAATVAAALPEPVDIYVGTSSAVRRRRAAAIQVIGAQAATVRDDDVAEVVEMLLQAAAEVWEAPLWSPLPELDALKAVASFGVRIPETAVDGILTVAGPALTRNTSASDIIAHLLIQTYWAVETRRQDLANALARMLQLPEAPYNLWDLVQQIPAAAREPLLAVVVALADEGRGDAIEVLARWRETSGAVQLAARRACAALLRRPVGIERTTMTVGTQESATVDLLLALLDADELIDVPTTELGPDQAQPAGGILMCSITLLPEGDAGSGDAPGTETAQDAIGNTLPPPDAPTPVVQDATPNVPDDAALTATGSPSDLAVAVAMHLAAMTEDERDGGGSRVQAVSALYHLVNRLPPAVARQLARRLAAVHQAPRLSETDRWEISTDTPFSRTRFNTGASDLAELALATSAKAFAAAHAGVRVTAADRAFVDDAMASAARLLRDDRPQTRLRGALTVTAIATVASEFSGHATGLLFHSDEQVRALGAAHAPATPQMFAILAQDPAPRVRAAVAGRASELPDAVRRALAIDSHLVVRRGITSSG